MTSLKFTAMAEAERAIVASCLTWGTMDEINLEPRHFTGPMWRSAWQVMQRLRDEGQAIDPILVADLMRHEGLGDVTPSELIKGAEDAGSAIPLAQRLVEAHRARSVALAASAVLTSLKEGASATEALDLAMKEFSAVDTGSEGRAIGVDSLVRARYLELVEILDARSRGETAATGLLTGIESLDRHLGGLQRGIVTVGAGRPGMGKTSFGMSVADGVTRAEHGCHVFNLEDTREAYSDRLLSRASGISSEQIRTCDLTPADMYCVESKGFTFTSRRGWLVDDSSGLTAEEIVRRVRMESKKNATAIAIIDYIQLLRRSDGIRERHEAIDHAMEVFANAAKDDRISYLVLSQLNRQCEARENKRPILSDLKASGGIEEKAKAIIFLYRPAEYEENAPTDQIELIIRKNNHGATGTAIAKWDAPTTRMF